MTTDLHAVPTEDDEAAFTSGVMLPDLLPALFPDSGALLAGTLPTPEPPTILHRQGDGLALFYRGRVNALFGDSEHGKTWVLLAAGAEVLVRGGRFAFLDLDDNGHADTLHRLIGLGVPVEVLADRSRFLFVAHLDDERVSLDHALAALGAWAAAAREDRQTALVGVDALDGLLDLRGGSANSDDDVSAAMRPLHRLAAGTGAGVLLVDHVAKGADSQRYGATGSTAKRRRVNGTYVRVVADTPFTPGTRSSCALWVVKDRTGVARAGGVDSPRAASRRERFVGNFVLEPGGDDDDGREVLRWWVTMPTPGDAPATVVGAPAHERVAPASEAEVEALVVAAGSAGLTVSEAVEQVKGTPRATSRATMQRRLSALSEDSGCPLVAVEDPGASASSPARYFVRGLAPEPVPTLPTGGA